MNLYYDLHVHTALSPCAEEEMTPNNIVAMARLKGLQVIAITDHQSCANCAAVMTVAERSGGPLVIPGLEIESAEEIHLLCLMPDLAAARYMAELVRQNLPDLANRPDIFGEQLQMNEEDQVIGHEARLLLQPCRLDCQTLAEQALSRGGVLIPAHIDREAYSMLQTLGTIPPDFPTRWLEYTGVAAATTVLQIHPHLKAYGQLYNSDAHRLAALSEAEYAVALPGKWPDHPTAVTALPTVLAALFSALRP